MLNETKSSLIGQVNDKALKFTSQMAAILEILSHAEISSGLDIFFILLKEPIKSTYDTFHASITFWAILPNYYSYLLQYKELIRSRLGGANTMT